MCAVPLVYFSFVEKKIQNAGTIPRSMCVKITATHYSRPIEEGLTYSLVRI